ncbi:P-loop containing nucleoside triphosphate hydrolase protein [Tothia fuscella]|uniref:P-loop containing nucleoside triphosphate hydrolase protein n=1 Tax=Tothia fuscella TaxID=1048955 RepID=A0A9P4NUA6_9PEZI|nr:P-loop containing nucleoside triphosphate hydrolase protein [Tothia fuscella]
MSEVIIDDKSEHCIPFLLERLENHQKTEDRPFFLGLNGVQGAGKSTLVSTLSLTLRAEPYSLSTAVLSLDDFYLRHEDQVALASSHPDNLLVQHRGQPSTHELHLLHSTLTSLAERRLTKLPVYDKSQYQGAGDRTDTTTWEEVNRPGSSPIDVVILEGWCVGFRALSDAELEAKWNEARNLVESGDGVGQLGRLKLSDVQFVNNALAGYESIWDKFDAFIHIDAKETRWVYKWRLEAEHKMRKEKGSGMTDEQVVKFIDGYYPAYELYTENLRKPIFSDSGRQLRLEVDEDRKVQQVYRL